MKPSEQCFALIKEFEGLRLKAYICPAGIPTIGYGRTRGVKMGDTCTAAQADAWCIEDVEPAARAVRSLVTVSLDQGQFDALCSFTYNLGTRRLAESTMLILLNKREYKKAACQLPLWVNGGGKRLPGLVRRRAAEFQLFMKCTP